MEQYILKSTVVAEINKLTRENELYLDENTSDAVRFQKTGAYSVLCDLRHFLDTLEVKEVDLEKIINDYFKDWKFDEELDIMVKPNNYSATFDDIKEVAKHFFELGIKAKDWKKERMEECPYRQVGCTMYEGKILECNGACSWVVDYPKLKELKAQKGE